MESSSAQQRATASESASPVVVGGKLIGAAESSSPPHLRVSSPLPQRRARWRSRESTLSHHQRDWSRRRSIKRSSPSPQQRARRRSIISSAQQRALRRRITELLSMQQRVRTSSPSHQRTRRCTSDYVAAPEGPSPHQRTRRRTKGLVAAPEDSSPRLWFRRRNAPEDSAAPERLVETPEGSSTQQGTPRRRIRVRCRISHQRASCRELFVVALESSCRRKREFGPPRRRIRGLVAAPESTSPHHLRVHRRRCTRAHE